jgi:hypothetical protein
VIERKQNEKRKDKFYKVVFLLKVDQTNRGWKPLPRLFYIKLQEMLKSMWERHLAAMIKHF